MVIDINIDNNQFQINQWIFQIDDQSMKEHFGTFNMM